MTASARQDTVTGWQDGALRVRVRAAAVRGKANEAVCRLMAKALGVPTGDVGVVHGANSRDKLLRIDGIEEEEVRRRLGFDSG